jgi:hypothetical protein
MSQDMDLLAETRTLVHAGKLYRPPDGSLEWNGWTELFVLLFDNYREFFYTSNRSRTQHIPFDGSPYHEAEARQGWRCEVSSQQKGSSAIS